MGYPLLLTHQHLPHFKYNAYIRRAFGHLLRPYKAGHVLPVKQRPLRTAVVFNAYVRILQHRPHALSVVWVNSQPYRLQRHRAVHCARIKVKYPQLLCRGLGNGAFARAGRPVYGHVYMRHTMLLPASTPVEQAI